VSEVRVSGFDGRDLYDLVWFPNQAWWDDLAGAAAPENWYDDASERPGILISYFKYYTRRVREEGRWLEAEAVTGETLAAFQTGLLSRLCEPIYAVLEANRERDRQPWVHKEWATASSARLGAFDLAELTRARFFSEPSELVFDSRLSVLADAERMAEEHVNRYPAALRANPSLRRAALEGAIVAAEAVASANWRVAVPQFYWPAPDAPGRVQLLLPLALTDPERVDLALVLDRTPDGGTGGEPACYRAYTVLPLGWAYRNARLMSRPESSWLRPRAIRAGAS
jgi:uncharacterized protein DUF3825